RLSLPLNEPPDAFQRALDLLVPARVARPDISFAAGAERITRDYRHALLFEKTLAERHAVEARHLHLRQRVERTPGFERRQPDRAEPIDDEPPPPVILGHHFLYELFALVERRNAGVLRRRWG